MTVGEFVSTVENRGEPLRRRPPSCPDSGRSTAHGNSPTVSDPTRGWEARRVGNPFPTLRPPPPAPLSRQPATGTTVTRVPPPAGKSAGSGYPGADAAPLC